MIRFLFCKELNLQFSYFLNKLKNQTSDDHWAKQTIEAENKQERVEQFTLVSVEVVRGIDICQDSL